MRSASSLHRCCGWILHKSNPNNSNDRRIGLNIQYLATHVKQLKHNKDSAICVRGVDKFKNFLADKPAFKDLCSTLNLSE